MTEKLNPKETVDLKEPLMSEVFQSEALVNLLERKGIITRKELLEEIRRLTAVRCPEVTSRYHVCESKPNLGLIY